MMQHWTNELQRFQGDLADEDSWSLEDLKFSELENDGYYPSTSGNLVSSRVPSLINRHKIALDIDIPALLVPSRTEGHHHLYLDVSLSWQDYMALLVNLNRAGIIGDGYLKASIARGATFLRREPLDKALGRKEV